ncbi:hypothetical protein D3C83_248470 [compost metagenome]
MLSPALRKTSPLAPSWETPEVLMLPVEMLLVAEMFTSARMNEMPPPVVIEPVETLPLKAVMLTAPPP